MRRWTGWGVMALVTVMLIGGCSSDSDNANGDGGGAGDGGVLTDGASGSDQSGSGDGSVGGDGAPACIDECTAEAKLCQGNGWRSCSQQSNGCYGWGAATACEGGQVCSGGICRDSCLNQCTAAARICSGAGYLECGSSDQGCTDWMGPEPCAEGTVCSGGQCMENCLNQCTEGQTQCAGYGVQTCVTLSTGCTEWSPPVPCALGELCSGGACVTTCQDQCTEGETRCSGPGVQECKTMPSGCTDWDTPQSCDPGSACVDGACKAGACAKGQRRCDGNNVEECDDNGVWIVAQTCPQACVNGACTGVVSCSPNDRRCSGNNVEECNPTGTAWLFLRSCPNGCQSGLCTGGCTPGEKRCNGDTPETCKTDGSGWQADAACSTFCYKGDCAEQQLILDNTTVSLSGEHVYAGDVQLKNNARIQVDGSGWLVIRAKNITIDSTSTIEATALGDAPQGAGGPGGTLSCQSYYCSYATSGQIGGGGGGYGTAGQGQSASLYNCYSNNYCTISSAGGAIHGGHDMSISTGSSGGSCSPANGGGMIDLIASDSMTVSGNLKAEGAAGSGDCGDGSGGGIRLVCEDLTADGVLSASALGANGGDGRVKLLYGSQNNIAATTSGVLDSSLMPPMDIASSTHPDPSLHYNDGAPQLNLAWSRPFSNLAGYYYKLSTALPASAADVPDATSTWHDTESVTFDADELASPTTVFHIVSVAPNATIGTVESNFTVQINTAPPSISSSSHASGSTWYPATTAVFSWSDPLPEKNFTAYYYVFDRYADTVPTKADSKLPITDKQLLKANLPQGSIWFMHVLAEDTMGYLTQQAGHFKVQIGPEPGLGGISGTIREAGSTPPVLLDDVTVTLNRGLLSTASASGGKYFFSDTVHEGSYELRASKEGYETFVQEVQVTAGNNTSLDIQLTAKP